MSTTVKELQSTRVNNEQSTLDLFVTLENLENKFREKLVWEAEVEEQDNAIEIWTNHTNRHTSLMMKRKHSTQPKQIDKNWEQGMTRSTCSKPK